MHIYIQDKVSHLSAESTVPRPWCLQEQFEQVVQKSLVSYRDQSCSCAAKHTRGSEGTSVCTANGSCSEKGELPAPRTAQTNPSPNPKSVVFSRFNSHYASMTKRSNTDTCSTLRTATSFAGRLRFIRQDSTRVLVYILPVCDAVLGTYSRVWVLQVTLGTGEFVSEPGHSSEC